MKDSEFIELLNLYLDHEISATDAARLEAEVQGNSARRAIYQDYCRMQKACRMLGEEFQTAAGSADERKVVAFESARPARAGLYTFGGLMAAAACVAFIVLGRNRESAAPEAAPAVAAVPVPAPAERAVARTVPDERPALGSPLRLAASGGTAANGSLFIAAEQPAAQFEWMRTLELAPVQRVPADALRFDARANLRPDSRTYNSRQPLDSNLEMTAFRFQK